MLFELWSDCTNSALWILGLDLHGLKEKRISSQERKEGNLRDELSAAADWYYGEIGVVVRRIQESGWLWEGHRQDDDDVEVEDGAALETFEDNWRT